MNRSLILALFVLLLSAAFFVGRASVGSFASRGMALRSTDLIAASENNSAPGARPKIKAAVSEKLAKIAERAPDRHKEPDANATSTRSQPIQQPSGVETSPAKVDPSTPPVPAEKLLADMLEKASAGVFVSEVSQGHDLSQREQVDPSWGPSSNQELADFFHDQFGDRFDVPTINCRTDICEILAASRIGGSIDDDARDFQRIPLLLRQQPWFVGSQFDLTNMPIVVGSSRQDPRVLFVMYITRK